jgi:hypothetical protein
MESEKIARWSGRLGKAFQIYLALFALFVGAYMSVERE